jgi:hypothetical protein
MKDQQLKEMSFNSRTGTLVFAVLVCLLVVTLIAGALTKTIVRHNRVLRLQHHRLQADWLADSAIDRAAGWLHRNPNYEGETWRISPEEAGGSFEGIVVIRVQPIDGNQSRRRVRVVSYFPADPVHRARVEREVLVDVFR